MVRTTCKALCLFLLLFILAAVNPVFSQETVKIIGKVLDAKTSHPIAFASIGMLGKPMGTVTNGDGKFEFNVPSSMLRDTMIVSNLGYFSYKVAVKDIKNTKSFFILLKTKVYDIKEVVITTEGTDAYEIVKRACDSLKRNLSSVPYISEGFYREYISENGKWSRAIETALSVYCDGKQYIGDYFFPIRMNGIRFSKNFLSEFVQSENYNQVSLFMTSTLDVKRFTMALTNMQFKVDSMIYLDNQLIWAISAKPEKTKEKTYYRYDYQMDPNSGKVMKVKTKCTFEVDKNTDHFYEYKYFITDGDFAFVKVSYRDTSYRPVVRDELKTYTGLFISYNTTRKSLEFAKYNNHWYPKYLSEYKEINYYKKKDSALYINVVKESDFLINAYQTELVTEIPKALEIKMFKDVYNQGFVYDKFFWNKYNKIADDNLRREVFADLRLAELERDSTKVLLYIALRDSLDQARSQSSNVALFGRRDTTATDVNEAFVEDLFFKVQLMAGKSDLQEHDPQFKGLRGVEKHQHDGIFKYTYGNEGSLNDALMLQKQLLRMGFMGAFIVPYYKGERITLDEGVEILNSR